MRHVVLGTIAAALVVAISSAAKHAANDESNTLVVHEWGTFTELHDFDGNSIGGVNTDDEPVPDFVHQVSRNIVQPTGEPWRRAQSLIAKGVLWSDRITTRLETPVIYFYPPEGLKEPMKLDVEVQLRGGWLTEYYPNATASAPGLKGPGLTQDATGSLKWTDLQIGAEGNVPKTSDHVWLAPRGPESAKVVTPKGEAEEYLFYRGVGAFSGPLRVETDVESDRLRLKSKFHTLSPQQTITIPGAWLVEVNRDGEVAYRRLPVIEVPGDSSSEIMEIDRSFTTEEFSEGNLQSLRAEMQKSLVEDGLYEDEAIAMLSTWDRAYFHSPGKRLFYLLPQEWTDDQMPLTISRPAKVDRVMMGRIELVTDGQKKLVAELAGQEPSTRNWMKDAATAKALTAFYGGEESAMKQIKVPEDYAAYLELGRFRNALIHSEYQKTKNSNILTFLKTNGLLTKEMIVQERLEKNKPKAVGLSLK